MRVIPGYVFTDDKNKRHITETDLVVRYKADRKEIRRYMTESVLEARRIEHEKRSTHKTNHKSLQEEQVDTAHRV